VQSLELDGYFADLHEGVEEFLVVLLVEVEEAVEFFLLAAASPQQLQCLTHAFPSVLDLHNLHYFLHFALECQ